MNERKTDWTAFAAALVSLLTVGIIVWIAVAVFGCASAPKGNVAGVVAGPQVSAERIELLESAVISMDRKLDMQSTENRRAGTGDARSSLIDLSGWDLKTVTTGATAAGVLGLLFYKRRQIRDAKRNGHGKPAPDPVPQRWRKAADALDALRDVDPVAAFGPQDETG